MHIHSEQQHNFLKGRFEYVAVWRNYTICPLRICDTQEVCWII
jgi:hypothetical protein